VKAAQIELRFSDGEILRAFERVSLRENFIDPLGSMEFTARPPRELIQKYANRLAKGELASVVVNGAPQAVGLIQTVSTSGGRAGIEFQIECQSVLATPYEANADPTYTFSSKTDAPASSIVLDIMRPFGFQQVFANAEDDVDVKVGVKVGRRGKEKIVIEDLKTQDCQCQESETAYGLCDRLLNRLGVILRVDVDGNLMLCRPRYDQDVAYTLVSDFLNQTRGNRMLDGWRIVDTNRNQFSEVCVRGERADHGAQTSSALPQSRVGVKPTFRPPNTPFAKIPLVELTRGRHSYKSDDSVAPYKPKFHLDKKCRDAQRATSLCKLIHGIKSKDAFVIDCTVDGWVSTEGRIWTVDTVARVVVEAIGLDANFWVLERTITLDRGEGQKTSLKLVPLNSVVIGDVPGG